MNGTRQAIWLGGYGEKALVAATLLVTIVKYSNVRNSARGHFIAWHKKEAMQQHLQKLVAVSNLRGRENSTVMLSGLRDQPMCEDGIASEIDVVPKGNYKNGIWNGQ